MRDYGKVYTRFWLKQNILSWSNDGKLLGLYLLTCPHCNLIGCFRLPIGYIVSDLAWDEQQATKALAELAKAQFIVRCQRSGWTMIRRFLKHNPIENPNQGKAAFKLLQDVPNDFCAMSSLLADLSSFKTKMPLDFSSLMMKTDTSSSPSNVASEPKVINKGVIKATHSITFEDFWGVQIRKEKKNKAKEEWLRLGLDVEHELAKEVFTRWKEQRRDRLQYQDRTKTPLPHNWLCNRQWEDEYMRIDEVLSTKQLVFNKNHQVNIEENNHQIAASWANPDLREVNSNDRG